MIQSNKWFPYSGPRQQKDDAINTFFSPVRAQDGTTVVEIIFGTKTLLTDVYAIGSRSGLKIAKVLQDGFRKGGIPINIQYDNVQEYFMGSVRNLLWIYTVGSNTSESHKHNNNPDKHCIQDIKGTTHIVLDHYGAPSWSWILCMAYAVVILN